MQGQGHRAFKAKAGLQVRVAGQAAAEGELGWILEMEVEIKSQVEEAQGGERRLQRQGIGRSCKPIRQRMCLTLLQLDLFSGAALDRSAPPTAVLTVPMATPMGTCLRALSCADLREARLSLLPRVFR